MNRLQGRLAIVTGGTSGIGADIARAMTAEGAAVIVTGRNEARGLALARELGDSAHFVAHDVAEETSWARVMVKAASLGDLDILVNCAGVMTPVDIEQTSYNLWLDTMRINAGGVFLGCKAAIAAMKAHGRPSSIVNVGSTTALKTAQWVFAYGASKAAALSMTRSIALHCAQSGYRIRCNAVLPGVVETPMLAPILEGSPDRAAAIEQLKSLHPIGRLLTGQEVANAVLYFASEASSGVTGTHICVDGGQTAG